MIECESFLIAIYRMFIFSGMCEVVMAGEKMPKDVDDNLDALPVSESSEEDEDDLEHASYDIQLDMNYGLHRQRSNTAVRLEKMEQARQKAATIKFVKWETNKTPLTETDLNDLFAKKPVTIKQKPVKSMLSEQLEKYTNMPQNPYMEYAKFDGVAQVGLMTRKYKIFLTMLPKEHRNYPIDICCIAAAKVQDLIGLICLKGSNMYGEYINKPVNHYGLFITEENGEQEHLPCLDYKECVTKYGFTCLGLNELESPNKAVSFDETSQTEFNNSQDEFKSTSSKLLMIVDALYMYFASIVFKQFLLHINK